MTDVEPLILDSLRRLVPAPGTAGLDWREVERRAGVASRQRRVLLVAAAVASLLLIAGVSLAATTGLPWWTSAAQPVHKPFVDQRLRGALRDSAQLRQMEHLHGVDPALARTVATSERFALVAAPIGSKGYCLIAFVPNPTLGTFCAYGNGPKPPGNYVQVYRRTSFDGGAIWILYGKIADPQATTLDLSEAAGVDFKIPLGPGGFFLAQVPRGRWAALSEQTGPGKILDSHGSTIATGCMSWGPSPAAVAPFIRQRLPKGYAGPSPNIGDENLGMWVDGVSTCKVQLPRRAPTLELKTARKIFTTTLALPFSIWKPGQQVALWDVKENDGTPCYLVWGTTLQTPTPLPRLVGLAGCRTRPAASSFRTGRFHGPFNIEASGGPHNRVWSTTIIGFVSPDVKHVARLELNTPSGVRPVAYKDAIFLTQFRGGGPFTPSEGRYVLTAYNAAGKVVARERLWKSVP